MEFSSIEIPHPNLCKQRIGLDKQADVREHLQVNERQREQVGRLVAHSTESSRAALSLNILGLRTNFVRVGRSDSGAEMVAVVDEIGRAGDYLLSELVSKIAPVSRTPQAFEELASAMRRWLRACDDELKEFARSARSARLQGRSLVLAIGQVELKKVHEAIERRLEIERFDFGQQSIAGQQPTPPIRAHKGGRPPAEFWDDLWASIAASLYDGALEPKSQADIERAMTTWIEAKGFSAAVSTVRARARRLWDRITIPEE